MTIPYRVQRGLIRFFTTLGVLALICIAGFAAWMLWLNRYVVYTDDGAKLDFNLSFDNLQGVIATPPASQPDISISYGNTDELLEQAGALKQVSGFTVTMEMLTGDAFAATKSALDALPEGSTVMMDVRNVRGEFYYTSSLGRTANKVDGEAVKEVIRSLRAKGCYLIARFSPFRDRWYFLDDEMGRVPYGLPVKGGNGSLWEDVSIKGMSHYWFDPTSTGALNFIVQVTTELRNLGFSEVVYTDFRFPDTDKIRFDGDRNDALQSAAETLVRACSSDTFAVSFSGNILTLPQGRCRLYLEGVPAGEIPELVASLTVETPEIQLVFLTDTMDTRYDD